MLTAHLKRPRRFIIIFESRSGSVALDTSWQVIEWAGWAAGVCWQLTIKRVKTATLEALGVTGLKQVIVTGRPID